MMSVLDYCSRCLLLALSNSQLKCRSIPLFAFVCLRFFSPTLPGSCRLAARLFRRESQMQNAVAQSVCFVKIA